MKHWLLGIAALAAWSCFSSEAQDLKDIGLGELRTNCVAEIEAGHCTSLKKIKVTDLKILAWFRMRDARPVYVDWALCWASLTTKKGPRWALVVMGRNPTLNVHPVDRAWHALSVTDVANSWLLYFDKPPTNDDVYRKTIFFHLADEKGWTLYDSSISEENWKLALGQKPERTFSNQSVQRTGVSRSASETNQAPPAAGSRR